jgi:hypothetical protein
MEKRRRCEDGGRDWNDTDGSQGCLEQSEASRDKGKLKPPSERQMRLFLEENLDKNIYTKIKKESSDFSNLIFRLK